MGLEERETWKRFFLRSLLECSKGRAHPCRYAGAADHVLKPRIAAQRIESGIHPDPRYSSGALQESLLKGIEGFLFFA